jgi:sialic acid synthase
MSNNFTLIAEIGCTHIGNIDRAKKLALLAKENGADVVKLQKRNPYESVPKSLWDKPHPNQIFSYGDTYLQHRINVELNKDAHIEFKEYCKSINIKYATSVWDMTSAKEMVEIDPAFIKIPSACNNNYDMLKYLFDNYNGKIHISLGMTTEEEREDILRHVYFDFNKVVLYHCTSGYPVPFEQLYIKEIEKLNTLQRENVFFGIDKPGVGFSNHGFGIAIEIAAYMLGARYFERHFIDDRTFKHTDASCSLEPQGLHKLSRNLQALEKTLQFKPETIDNIEMEQRKKLRT